MVVLLAEEAMDEDSQKLHEIKGHAICEVLWLIVVGHPNLFQITH